MYVLSAGSITRSQTAPTCLIDPDGRILASAPRNQLNARLQAPAR